MRKCMVSHTGWLVAAPSQYALHLNCVYSDCCSSLKRRMPRNANVFLEWPVKEKTDA